MDGVQQLMFLKFPQGSLMNIKMSEQLELQESFNVLQELEITLKWTIQEELKKEVVFEQSPGGQEGE